MRRCSRAAHQADPPQQPAATVTACCLRHQGRRFDEADLRRRRSARHPSLQARLTAPGVNQRRRYVILAGYTRHAGARRKCLRQNLRPLVLAPAPPTLTPAENRDLPKKHYDELRSAVADGRVRAGPRDQRSGLISLDQGRNVFSVDLLGPEDVALSCEINGFHTPSFVATCQWAHDGASFSIEGSPTVISHAVIHRKALEGAWSRRVGDANGGG